jgi:hypothetical protein
VSIGRIFPETLNSHNDAAVITVVMFRRGRAVYPARRVGARNLRPDPLFADSVNGTKGVKEADGDAPPLRFVFILAFL